MTSRPQATASQIPLKIFKYLYEAGIWKEPAGPDWRNGPIFELDGRKVVCHCVILHEISGCVSEPSPIKFGGALRQNCGLTGEDLLVNTLTCMRNSIKFPRYPLLTRVSCLVAHSLKYRRSLSFSFMGPVHRSCQVSMPLGYVSKVPSAIRIGKGKILMIQL